MENNLALLNLLERILGNGQRKSRGNYAFVCPFHTSNPPGKRKLEVNLETGQWKCWTCNDVKGTKIKTLLERIEVPQQYFDELKMIQPGVIQSEIHYSKISLPKEYYSLHNFTTTEKFRGIKLNQALQFLKLRGITKCDIIKYNIGICFEGPYEDRIIVPSYDGNGDLNYFVARDFTGSLPEKYRNPVGVTTKDVVGMELSINWGLPVTIVEGIFDALAIKHNVIPLFGKVIHEKLFAKLVESKVKKIYIALDNDARKDALQYCEQLINFGKEVYLVELEGKDPSEIGYEKYLKIVEQTEPLTFATLLNKKLERV